MQRLEEEPKARPRDLAELMSLASAMEEEAVRRYDGLAADMEKIGELGVAGTFLALVEEERDHVAEINRWSIELTGALPLPASRPWTLPPEIGRSWAEVAASTRLTPYRALSIAVHNEERGFAFYTYVAAHTDPRVAAAAERLAVEELRHAASLRQERRRAYRRERAARSLDPSFAQATHSLPAFRQQSSRLQAVAAARHRLIAERLAGLDADTAGMLERIAEEERRAGEGEARAPQEDATIAVDQSVPALLRAALTEAEKLHDAYLDLADHGRDEQVVAAAQAAAERTMHHLGSIAAALHSRAP
jgi:rubrerythrin